MHILYASLFFMSGLFFKPDNLWNRIYRLTIPFIVFYAITLLVSLYPVLFRDTPFDMEVAFEFLAGQPLVWNTSLWFLISLSIVALIEERLHFLHKVAVNPVLTCLHTLFIVLIIEWPILYCINRYFLWIKEHRIKI